TAAVGEPGLEFVLARTDRPDGRSTETASALLHVHLTDADPVRAGRAFSQAAVELALGSYPGCVLTTPPGDASPFGVFTAGTVAQQDVPHVAVLPSGERVPIPPPPAVARPPSYVAPAPAAWPATGTVPRPIGTVVGARSGDKGGDANLGVWARTDRAYAWLRAYLTVDELRTLLPGTGSLDIDRYELPNLRALNFVVHG